MKRALKRFAAAVTVAMMLLFAFTACGATCEACDGRGGRDRELLGIPVGTICNSCWDEAQDILDELSDLDLGW